MSRRVWFANLYLYAEICTSHISGLYLTDLSFVHDVMNHRSPSNMEDRKMHEDAMNRLIRSIAAFQDSNYGKWGKCDKSYREKILDHLLVIPYIQQYLDSLRFHREMIKFVEEDLYRYFTVLCNLMEIFTFQVVAPPRTRRSGAALASSLLLATQSRNALQQDSFSVSICPLSGRDLRATSTAHACQQAEVVDAQSYPGATAWTLPTDAQEDP